MTAKNRPLTDKEEIPFLFYLLKRGGSDMPELVDNLSSLLATETDVSTLCLGVLQLLDIARYTKNEITRKQMVGEAWSLSTIALHANSIVADKHLGHFFNEYAPTGC